MINFNTAVNFIQNLAYSMPTGSLRECAEKSGMSEDDFFQHLVIACLLKQQQQIDEMQDKVDEIYRAVKKQRGVDDAEI